MASISKTVLSLNGCRIGEGRLLTGITPIFKKPVTVLENRLEFVSLLKKYYTIASKMNSKYLLRRGNRQNVSQPLFISGVEARDRCWAVFEIKLGARHTDAGVATLLKFAERIDGEVDTYSGDGMVIVQWLGKKFLNCPSHYYLNYTRS